MLARATTRVDRRRLTYLGGLVTLAACYIAAARVGLEVNAVSGFATLVWAPSGIALASLVVFGSRLWPGVWVGAIVANFLTGAPWPVALGIATGNTIEALVGAYALRSFPRFERSLDRVADVLALIGFAAVLSTTFSATIGLVSLRLGGLVAPTAVGETWRTWWLGDLIGDLLVAPLLLVWWTSRRAPVRFSRVSEAAALAVCVIATSFFVFAEQPGAALPLGEAYLMFPVLIWATLRFGQRGGVTATFFISLVAVWGTVLGHGPFVRPVLYTSLLSLQAFMGVTAATFLVLGASVSERRAVMQALEGAVAEQKTLHGAAVEANQAKSQFLAVMSHELRTPLTAIGGYADLLTLEAKGPLTDLQRDYVSRIRRNGEHLLRLIDQILHFARIEAGQVTLELEDVPVHDALTAVQASIEPQVAQRGLRFDVVSCDESLTVRADRGRLHQVLVNLATNAVKFTEPGGVVTMGAQVHREDGNGTGPGARVEVWVRDTGVGIPANQLQRVLEPFVQLDQGNRRRYPGVGLGLSIARDLTRAMEGELRLDSAVGRGTTATLVLPSR
jgi:signal transduction histidine kinase